MGQRGYKRTEEYEEGEQRRRECLGCPRSGTIEQDSFSPMRRAKEDVNIMSPPLLFFLVSHFFLVLNLLLELDGLQFLNCEEFVVKGNRKEEKCGTMGNRRHERSAEEKRGPHATTWKRKDERRVESQRRKAEKG